MILNIALPPQEVAMSAAAVQTADGSVAVATTATTANAFVQIFDIIVFLCLVFIPSNTFGSKNR